MGGGGGGAAAPVAAAAKEVEEEVEEAPPAVDSECGIRPRFGRFDVPSPCVPVVRFRFRSHAPLLFVPVVDRFLPLQCPTARAVRPKCSDREMEAAGTTKISPTNPYNINSTHPNIFIIHSVVLSPKRERNGFSRVLSCHYFR